MGCTCSKAFKAPEPSRNPTLLENGRQSALPIDVQCPATEEACEGADVDVPSSMSGAKTADVEPSLKPDVAMPLLEGEDTCRDCSWSCCSTCRAPAQTRRLESWELQLLRVSSELKMKLKDPHFVAKRCDLDSSGDLDMHELKQATRAFGLKFSAEELLEFMAGAARINKERFAQIVDAPVTSADRSRPTIPHSLRGMALGQLQQLESIFVTSGWLSAKCNAFNLEYADAIREGKKFPQAANLYAMDTFVVTPMSQPGKCDARDQDSAKVVPEADENMSFSEVVNPCGLIVHCFVSHFWGHLFSQTVTALRRWAEMNREGMGTESPKSVVFWICLFALNQHAVADEVGENPMQGPFNAALAQAEGGAVMVLDEEINPFKRIWCLFEISRLKELNQPFELICEMGSLSKPESLAVQQADPAAVERLLQATCEALSKVSALNAKASVKEDQIRIWQEIADPGLRKMLRGNAGALRRGIIKPEGLEPAFTEFNRFSQALLSTSLLEFYLVHNQHVAAAKCCEKGACFTQEQFADIITHGISEADRPTWLSNLLVINATDARLGIVRLLLQSRVCMEAVHCSLVRAAHGGHKAVTQLLLDHGADVEAADNNGQTALSWAACKGHEAVTKLLLNAGADVAAADNNGQTALISAAFPGHEAVTKLLLNAGADVAAADNNGQTALMLAAACGHQEVAKLSLDQGADVLAAANNGATALMLAARGGHEAVTKLLLDHGADVAAADNNGQTALMLAAACGHQEVAKLSLDQGADVLAAANNGATALMLAARGGHEAVTKLLLDHGADVAAADNNGQTALMLAVAGCHVAVTKIFLDRGADVAATNSDGVSAIVAAAQTGNEAVAKLLLDHGADAAAAINNGRTALMLAAAGGHEVVTKLLLDAGADVAAADEDGQTALMLSAAEGHEAVTKLLLDHGADVAATTKNGQTAMIQSAFGGHEAVTKLLLNAGADVAAATSNGQTALLRAAFPGHEAVTKLLLNAGADVAAADNNGQTALISAAFGGHEAVTKLLLDHGADVAAADNNGLTALMLAVAGCHEAVTKLLLDAGADVAAATSNGQTALLRAAFSGHEAVTKLLLNAGADVAAAHNNGQTALINAAFGGHEAVTKLLLDHGADVAAADNNGRTALMLAAAGGHEAVTKLLLDAGADVAAADEDCQTALMLALAGGHEAVAKVLLDHGADIALDSALLLTFSAVYR